MGIYINPKDTSKEAWLEDNAIGKFPLQEPPPWPAQDEGWLPVALVDNGGFTAAGICFSKDEYDVFSSDISGRPILWFRVPTARLNEVTNQDLTKFYKEKSRS